MDNSKRPGGKAPSRFSEIGDFIKLWFVSGFFLGVFLGFGLVLINRIPHLFFESIKTVFISGALYAFCMGHAGVVFALVLGVILRNRAVGGLRAWAFPSSVAFCLFMFLEAAWMENVGRAGSSYAHILVHALIVFGAVFAAAITKKILPGLPGGITAPRVLALPALMFAVLMVYGQVSLKSKINERGAPDAAVSRRVHQTGLKVLIVGVDGASWNIINPLLKNRQMPELDGVMERGVYGALKSERPLKSPRIWATITTGKHPSEHGIESFKYMKIHSIPNVKKYVKYSGMGWLASRLKLATETVYNSNDFKVKTIWDIAGGAGRTVGTFNWWCSWPAKKVSGINISTHAYSAVEMMENGVMIFDPKQDRNLDYTYPPEIFPTIIPVIADTNSLKTELPEYMEPFRTDHSGIGGYTVIPQGSVDLYFFHLMNDIRSLRLHHYLFGSETPDLEGIYFRSTDTAGHYYYRYHQPDWNWKYKPGPEAVSKLKNVINNQYRSFDQWAGELLKSVPRNTVVIFCSDHGMGPFTKKEPEVSGDHLEEGIVMMVGPPLIQGGILEEAGIYDIAPTILYLSGLAVPRDMPGSILTAAIKPEFLEKFPPVYIDTYETGDIRRTAGESRNDIIEQESLKQLRDLKYVQ